MPTDEFAVFGGGVLAIRGLREINDLDLMVLGELWEKLVLKYPTEKTSTGGDHVHLAEDIEAMAKSDFGFGGGKKI